MKNNKPTVIDFFCWAGGFSEWFRQQWFNIVMWIDYWQPAIDSHNLNHGLKDERKSVLDFWSEDDSNIDEINKLQDTTCIIGSPPCVSFSSSNKSWKADKTQWIQLIESFLRVVAVKKHQEDSKLVVWYMENVPNSKEYVEEEYTFDMLNLWSWAKLIWKKPSGIALKVKDNWEILNSWDFGAPQSRKRFICGEWCETNKFLAPKITHEWKHVTLWDVLEKLPSPTLKKEEVKESKFKDPNYWFELKWHKFSDHFYDTGLYIIEWDEAFYLKTDHWYMWKMSFPENESRPCRTIMATRSAKTRESLILESEYKRKGNGEYRLPTIREIATFMGFPINYQFTGSEWSKWRQIGNAVSPHLSSALAKAVREKLNLWQKYKKFSELDELYKDMELKLNDFKESKLDKPKRRSKYAKFRRHPLKLGNMTVELMNYTIDNPVDGKNWYIEVFAWTWEWFYRKLITKDIYLEVEEFLLSKKINLFEINKFLENFSDLKIEDLQMIYEEDLNLENPHNPVNIVKSIKSILKNTEKIDFTVRLHTVISYKDIPFEQVLILYILWKIIFN